MCGGSSALRFEDIRTKDQGEGGNGDDDENDNDGVETRASTLTITIFILLVTDQVPFGLGGSLALESRYCLKDGIVTRCRHIRTMICLNTLLTVHSE